MINQFLSVVKSFCCLFIVASITGCQMPNSKQVLPELTFQHLESIRLNVAKIEILHSYNQSMSAPFVEHLFHTPPAVALERWARDRLRSAGKEGFARFSISKASVIETKLDTKKGFMGLFTKDQSERYDAILEAKLEVFSDNGNSWGFAKAQATRSTTVREDVSINQRDHEWFNLTEELIRDMDYELEKSIYKFLPKWIINRAKTIG